MSRDALVVGINSYQYLQSLKAPATDAEAVAQRLVQDGEFRVWRVPEQIDQTHANTPMVATTQTVSQLQLEQSLKQLFRPGSAQAPETALFYFSGHGIPDEEGFDYGYLAASDTNPKNPRSGLSLRWLQWLLSESSVKQQIIWLDCCHSGSLIVNVGAANPGNSESRDRCFIASSRDFENSWEDLNSTYSVLTKALLDGLEPSRLPGRWIDTFALVDYVNQMLKGELQTPICTNFGEAINLTRNYAKQEATTHSLIPETPCPYKGLLYFEDNNLDYQYFYGRRSLTDELLDIVRTSNFMAIVGASGSGKSSVLRAGLLHQLRQGRISGSDRWDIRLIIPGEYPCQTLSTAFIDAEANYLERTIQLGKAETLINEGADGLRRLVQTTSSERIVLVVDQFEELFTLCQSATERQHFLNTLIGALKKANNKLCLIIAMRSDFIGRCFEKNYGGLSEFIRAHLVPVKAMVPDELRQAIEAPAQRVGLKLEPELLQMLIEDVDKSLGSLPLLQYTLKMLWDLRKENTLALKAYIRLGGVTGSLKKRADEIYKTLNTEQQRIAKHIFLKLTHLGKGAEDTRRRISKDSLITAHHSATLVDQTVKHLADENLVVTSELVHKDNGKRTAIVEIVHESLIRNWPRLQQWLEENRTLLNQQRKIEQAAEEWQAQGKPLKEYLLQGQQLSDAKHFQHEHGQDLPLSILGNTYIQQSVWLEENGDLFNLLQEVEQAAEKWQTQKLHSNEYLLHGEKLVDIERFQNRYRDISPLSQTVEKYIAQSLEYRQVQHKQTKLMMLMLIFLFITVLGIRPFLKFLRIAPDLQLVKTYDSKTNPIPRNLLVNSLQSINAANYSLAKVDLESADLRYIDFEDINLRAANLTGTALKLADLRTANLSNANLSNADLSNANLSNANLNKAIFLATDLRTNGALTKRQLEGKNPPYICNSPLPLNIEIEGGKDRDCNKLADILYQKGWFRSSEAAAAYVKEQRQKTWE